MMQSPYLKYKERQKRVTKKQIPSIDQRMLMTRTKQEVYDELQQHLLQDDKPSEYINRLSKASEFNEYPFELLLKLKRTEQSAKYHPEGSVWNHTMLVVDEAAKVRGQSMDEQAFMWAALLHDIGKPETTRNRKGKITSYEHDTKGALRAEEFLRALTVDEKLIRKVIALVKYHMHMLYVLKKLPFGNPERMLQEVDPQEIALLCRCDRLGREGVNQREEEDNYREFISVIDRHSQS